MPVCFRRFGRKGYSLFSVLGKEVIISVLSVATLTHASAETVSCRMLPEKVAPTDEEIAMPGDSLLTVDEQLQQVEVVGTLVPMSPDKAVRLVQVIRREDIVGSAAHTVNDLLKLVAGVDVRQRGAFGVQTDIGVNGGTQDQVTVLLNGVNITSAHTGHLTMDLPVSTDDIERIEVLEGGASRIYGSSAFSGAINIVTRKGVADGAEVSLQGGSYGTAMANAALSVECDNVSQRVSGAYSRSDGGTDNSDFEKYQGFYRGEWQTGKFDLRWQTGISSMKYGANTFYSARFNNQYEENSRYMASVSGEYKGRVHILPMIHWNQSLDHYVLNRENPAAYENFHRATSYGASLNAWTQWALGKSAVGVELRREQILSSSLGRPLPENDWHKVSGHDAYYKNHDGRNNWNVFLEHDITLDDITVSLGLVASKNTALSDPMRIYPGVDVSWRPADGWRVYASFNQSLRMPTYTDLYYTGPNLEGNPDLKPEKSTDVSVGWAWHHDGLSAQMKGFYRRGTNMIDWVKFSASDSNHAANLDLDYYGTDILLSLDAQRQWGSAVWLKKVTLAYNYIYQTKQNVPADIYSSSYALDYLRHKLCMTISHRVWNKLEAQWEFAMKQRNGCFDLYDFTTASYTEHGYGTHATLDLRLQWAEPRYTLFVQGSNLTNHRYYDISNVQLPGFWFMGGIKLNIPM